MSEWAIPVTTKTIHAIRYSDLENLVNKTYFSDKDPGEYGRNLWDFVANEECGNDSDHEFSTVHDLDEYEQKDLDKFKAGDVTALQWNTSLILTDLANQNLIPHGDILVSVCW